MDLLQRLNERDPKALEAVYRDSFPSCAALIMKDKGTMDDAREIFQQAMFSLLQKLSGSPDFEITSNINAYMKTACRYMWINHKKKHRKVDVLDEARMELEDEGLAAVEEKEAKFGAMYHCLEQASEECRKLLKLTFFKKKSDAEIAPLMDYTKEFVKNKRRRCMKAMRECMGAN